MKILVVGAGAVGGYFGGRLVEAGRNVTFLVRTTRAEEIRRLGLRIVSPHGDAILCPRVVLSKEIVAPYDLVLVTVKAYGLESAMDDFAPAVASGTIILPLLNGMSHLGRLRERFGQERVIGGVCLVSTDLGAGGEIVQLSKTQKLIYGELSGLISQRTNAVDEALRGANFQTQLSQRIQHDMWEKWVLLASLAALTCLLRGSVGEIEAVQGGAETAIAILHECSEIAAASGFKPDEAWLLNVQTRFTAKGSDLTSSMYRDLLKGSRVEVKQIIGDLLRHGQERGVHAPLLRAAFVNLTAYSSRLTV